MKNRYRRVMERVCLDESMRTRILRQIDAAAPPAPLPFRWKKYAAAAAACLLLLTGGILLSRMAFFSDELTQPPLTAVPGIREVSSTEALSAAVGFAVPELFGLPFTPEKTTYTAYEPDLAQISYEGQGQEAVFRKARGLADTSGDHTIYPQETTLSLTPYSVQLKGEGESYVLALWSDGAFSYSIRLSEGWPAQAWQDFFLSFLQ